MKRGECLAVLCLDLDHFKSVNDTLGHPIGDELLKVVADRLRHCTREPDTIARLGGDEFAIIMTAMHQPSDAAFLSQRVREAITKPFELDGHQMVVDVSIGIAIAPLTGPTRTSSLNARSRALQGKSDVRGTYRFFEPEMDPRMRQARSRKRLRRRSSTVNSSCTISLWSPWRATRLPRFEALLRWKHPVRGTVSPADFIPVAEETGLIIPLGDWVLRKACEETAHGPKTSRSPSICLRPS